MRRPPVDGFLNKLRSPYAALGFARPNPAFTFALKAPSCEFDNLARALPSFSSLRLAAPSSAAVADPLDPLAAELLEDPARNPACP